MARPLSDMTAILAGATSGMGLEIAAQLAESGVPRIILNGRDKGRAELARAAIVNRAPICDVRTVLGDASSEHTIEAIRAAAEGAPASLFTPYREMPRRLRSMRSIRPVSSSW
jgi:2-hydroxycyclohexanecarboxyl-CoA dehydrogenase